jgi:hypothetical protein
MIVARRLVVWAGAHAWLGWLLCLPILWKVAGWAADNTPPFEIHSYEVASSGPPGGEVRFHGLVRRDLERGCSVSFTRHIVDARGFRHDFDSDPRNLSAQSLRKMAAEMKDDLRLAVNIPKAAAVGPAAYTTDLAYVCNPWQRAFPIHLVMTLNFDVLPAAPPEARP